VWQVPGELISDSRWGGGGGDLVDPGGHLAAHIALGVTWGGLVGDRGHRKGQLRVLGSPSARHTEGLWTGGAPRGGGESADPLVFGESPLVHI
jgi:hypothetical protein